MGCGRCDPSLLDYCPALTSDQDGGFTYRVILAFHFTYFGSMGSAQLRDHIIDHSRYQFRGSGLDSIGLLLSTVASDPAPSPPPPPPSTVAPPTTASASALCTTAMSTCSTALDTMTQAMSAYTDATCEAFAAAAASPAAVAALQAISPDCSLTAVFDAFSSAKTCTAYFDASASQCTTMASCTSCSRRLAERSEVSYSARMTVGFSDAGKADVFSTSVTRKNVRETFFPESMRTDVAQTTSRIQVLDCTGAAPRSDGSCNVLAAPIYYKVVTSGYCGPCRDASCTDSHGGAYQYVTTQDECKAAASYLAKKGKTIPPSHVDMQAYSTEPAYCTYYPTAQVTSANGPDALWMLSGDNTGKCSKHRECLCASVYDPDEDEDSSGSVVIIVVLAVVGLLVVMIVVGVLTYVLWQKKKKQMKPTSSVLQI